MKFQLAVNMERMEPGLRDMVDEQRHVLEMVQMADEGGFHIAWAAEHHALEMTIAPNPFQILTWWAAHTNNIRLGSAVAVAAYWHPINLAGEAALLDLFSGGRLEFGIGSGAYQREFDRMRPGLSQKDGWRYMQEMLPVVRKLWAGDYAHDGKYWQFPTATSVPKPLQKSPRVWVAARAPITFDYAVKNNCHIMSWPFTMPMSEAKAYRQRLDDAMANNPGCNRPIFAIMRHTAVYDNKSDWKIPIRAAQRQLAQFGNLMQNVGEVINGLPNVPDMANVEQRRGLDSESLHKNMLFGTPDEVIEKLKRYQALGVDEFIYYASLGLGHKEQKRSLELFCKEVMPAFA